jgi:hypothetical protein
MKLSRTGWNNVIIFSVMLIILLINTTNNRLFPENNKRNDELLLPQHSTILTLLIKYPNNKTVMLERKGRAWKITNQGITLTLNNQQIEQLMFTWQQSSGLVQADDMIIEGQQGIEVEVSLAGINEVMVFTLYSLTDQLLIFNQQKKLWLALPRAISQQLVPNT